MPTNTAKTQKLTLIAKLLFSLSNNCSIPTAFEYRLVALEILPTLEDIYINLTSGTFESLRKSSGKVMINEYGTGILELIKERWMDLRQFKKFISMAEQCYRAAKEVR